MNRIQKIFSIILLLLFSNLIFARGENSLLYKAVQAKNIKQVKVLIQGGAYLNEQNEENKTALHCAVENRSIEIVKVLISAGAPLDSQAWYGWTPLHWAVYVDSSEIVEVLIQAGADINRRNNYDYNALELTFHYGKWHRLKIAKSLVAGGARLFKDSTCERFVWEYAACNDIEMLKILIHFELNLDYQCSSQLYRTALHQAVIKNYYEIAKILIESGASISITDEDGLCPADYAKNNRMKSLFQR